MEHRKDYYSIENQLYDAEIYAKLVNGAQPYQTFKTHLSKFNPFGWVRGWDLKGFFCKRKFRGGNENPKEDENFEPDLEENLWEAEVGTIEI